MDKTFYIVVKSWYNTDGYLVEDVFEWLSDNKELAIQYVNLLNDGNYSSKDGTKIKYYWFEKRIIY